MELSVHIQCKTKRYQCLPKRKFNRSAISCSARVRKALWQRKGRLVRLDKCQGARDNAAVSDDMSEKVFLATAALSCRECLALAYPDISTHAVCFHGLNKITHIMLHFSLRPQEMFEAPCSKMALQCGLQSVDGRLFSSVFQRLTNPGHMLLPPSLPHHPQGQTKFTAFGSQEFVKCCSNRRTQPRGWLTLNSGIYTLHDHFAALSPPHTHTQAHARARTHTRLCDGASLIAFQRDLIGISV